MRTHWYPSAVGSPVTSSGYSTVCPGSASCTRTSPLLPNAFAEGRASGSADAAGSSAAASREDPGGSWNSITASAARQKTRTVPQWGRRPAAPRRCLRSAAVKSASPAGAGPTDVDVRERPVRPRGAIETATADECRVGPLDALGGVEDHLRVTMIDPTVAVQIVHAPVAVVVD